MASPFDDLITDNAPAEFSSQKPYDIFINHHGGDVKHGLATTIYSKLDATGLRVFLDKDELKIGDFFPRTLEDAMRNASLSIAIFSKNYAKSPWCLAELKFILYLPQVKFIPIFYHVEPSILRWAIQGKEIYAKAFSQYEIKGRYSSELLQSWKLALHKASLYNGEIISNQSDEEEAVMNVVNRVLKELMKVRLDVAKHPVGLDELEQDFHNKIALQSVAAGPTQIVGIWGMSGVGKTTFAKHLYNNKCSTATMKRSSFVFDVREAARGGRLHEKQKELLEDLDLESRALKNVDQGKEILRSRLRSVSVLIVLDDVDDANQLDALLPAMDSLGQGSLIIVTTRDLKVLKAWGISAVYTVPSLNRARTHELFCWHAFQQPSPLSGFEELAENFVDACCGLPLFAVVIGSLLCGEHTEAYWQSQLDKLSRLLLLENIKSRLKISYDALDKEEKEMFLDIACLFPVVTSCTAIAVWDGSGWNGVHGLRRLVNKCLVELEPKSSVTIIRMHDILRDLGREIGNQQSPYRLWSRTQIIGIQPQQEAIRIRGMVFAFGENCFPWEGKIILNTSQGERTLEPGSLGLKILAENGRFINEQCSKLSRELIFLSCDRFEHERFPSWLSLKNLRVLQLHYPQRLQDLWERNVDVPLQLKKLVIIGGYGLEKIESLRSLRSLETLLIVDCTELNTLSSLTEATFLKTFDLRGCNKLEKIESVEGLRSLETFQIYDCTELNTLPSLAEATSLKMFSLSCCNKLEKIESLEGLRSLETFQIYDCTELNTLSSLGKATSLKTIDLRGCNKLEKMGSLQGLRSLETLLIIDSKKLNTLPSLAEATCLKTIFLSGCNKLEKIESLEGLRSLETLKIHDCTELDTFPSLGKATSLKMFELSCSKKLEKIESLGGLRSLETLRIYDCTELNTLPSLAEATSLKMFDLRGCNKLKKIESLKGLRSLETLKIHDCTELNTFPSLAEATSLKIFELNCCNKLEKIISLEGLRSLETLIIIESKKLNTLPSLAQLTCLEEFQLKGCHELDMIGGLEGLTSLKKLKVHTFSKRACMFNLEHSDTLEVLEVVANDRSVVETSISSIQKWQREVRTNTVQKWQREVIVCTRSVFSIDALKLLQPGISMENVAGYESSVGLLLNVPERDYNAILICFFIDYVYPELVFQICTDTDDYFIAELTNGTWLWMGVFPEGSNWLLSKGYRIRASCQGKEVKAKEIWFDTGEEQRILELFYQLSKLPASVENISEEQLMAKIAAFKRLHTTVV